MRQAISQQLPEQADSIAGVLDHGFELFARSFWRASGFFFISGVCNACFAILSADAQGTMGNLLGAGRIAEAFARYWWLLPVWLTSLLLSVCFSAAAYVRIYAIAKHADIGFKAAVKHGLQLAPRSFGLSLLALLAMIGAMLVIGAWFYGAYVMTPDSESAIVSIVTASTLVRLLIIIGLGLPPLLFFMWVVIPFVLAPFILVRDDLRVLDAISTSFRLVRKNFWRAIVISSVPGVLFMIAYSAVIGVMVYTVVRGAVAPSSFAFNALTQILAIPTFAALMPLFTCSCMALINDLWLRREGTDLHHSIARTAELRA